MTELLEEWAKLEPKRCRYYAADETFMLIYSDSINDYIRGISKKALALIQYAAQEAAMTHKFYIGVHPSSEPDKGKWEAYQLRARVSNEYYAETPAYALLAVYLRALKKELA